jgi:hypothetical protein
MPNISYSRQRYRANSRSSGLVREVLQCTNKPWDAILTKRNGLRFRRLPVKVSYQGLSRCLTTRLRCVHSNRFRFKYEVDNSCSLKCQQHVKYSFRKPSLCADPHLLCSTVDSLIPGRSDIPLYRLNTGKR